jgi:hypothetical protein
MSAPLAFLLLSVLGFTQPSNEDHRKVLLESFYAKKCGCDDQRLTRDQCPIDLASIQYCDVDGDGVEEAIVNGSDCASGTGGPNIHDVLRFGANGKVIVITPVEATRSRDTFNGQPIFDTIVGSCNCDVSYQDGMLYYVYRDSSGKPKPLILKFKWLHGRFQLVEVIKNGLTLRSTRTPPALPSVLSQLFASSASFNASVQVGPVSFIR